MFLSFIHFIVIAAKRKEVTVEANLAYELHRADHQQSDPVYELVGKS